MDVGLTAGGALNEFLKIGQTIQIFFDDTFFEAVKLQNDDFGCIIHRLSRIGSMRGQR